MSMSWRRHPVKREGAVVAPTGVAYSTARTLFSTAGRITRVEAGRTSRVSFAQLPDSGGQPDIPILVEWL